MGYLIFEDWDRAVATCKKIDRKLELPESESPIYDFPRKHPEKDIYEIFIEDYAYPVLEEEEKSRILEKLPDDWYG